MGKKDGELWDDSALIDAFEDAVSSYKMMHGMKQIDGLKDENKAVDDAPMEIADDDSRDASSSAVEATSPTKEEEAGEDVMNVIPEQEAVEGDSKMQPLADYNLLVNQYYELQEKLLMTWEQLQQLGYLGEQVPHNTTETGFSDRPASVEASGLSSDAICADIAPILVSQNNECKGTKPEMCQQHLPSGCLSNQYSYSASVQGACSLFQEHAIIVPGSLSTAVCYCCTCTNKCVVYSPCPVSVCKLCIDTVPGFGPEKSLPLEDNGFIKVAMEAADKAISSIKIQTSDRQDESGNNSTGSKGTNFKDDGCETDISTVLNAWFSAGLATGKHLAEQSNARRKEE